MDFNITINNENITVEFVQASSVKHCYIKILDASTVRVKAHKSFTLTQAKEVIQKKYAWLEKHITRLQEKELASHEFYYLGKKYDKRKNFLNDSEYETFLKQEAPKVILPIVEEFASTMQCHPTQVKFRKNKSRWGSCSSKDVINFNILLLKFPKSVIEYIVVHELAHIKHKNHSKAFWNCVAQFYPTYKEQERLLKLF